MIPPAEPPTGYPESSQATTALVLGILGLVLCQLLGPFAWWIGNEELKAIDAGRRTPLNRGQANAGKIMGIISTVLLGLAIVAGVVFLLALIPVAVHTGG